MTPLPEYALNDNEGTIPQQIAHLESSAALMREDIAEARAELLQQPYDEQLAKQLNALEGLLQSTLAKIERLKRRDRAS
jgi:hypothetical protein